MDQTIVQNKRRHKMKGKCDQKSRTSNINSISCPNPDVSFSIIYYSFWLCMVTKRVYRDQKSPEKEIIAEVEIMAWIQENKEKRMLAIHLSENCVFCASYRKL